MKIANKVESLRRMAIVRDKLELGWSAHKICTNMGREWGIKWRAVFKYVTRVYAEWEEVDVVEAQKKRKAIEASCRRALTEAIADRHWSSVAKLFDLLCRVTGIDAAQKIVVETQVNDERAKEVLRDLIKHEVIKT
jgi:hypothetical protein